MAVRTTLLRVLLLVEVGVYFLSAPTQVLELPNVDTVSNVDGHEMTETNLYQ